MRYLLAFALLLAPANLEALEPELVPLQAGQQVTIRPDRAYILFRTVRPEGVHSFEPIFMRVLRPDEDALYENQQQAYREHRKVPRWNLYNVDRVDASKPFVKAIPENVYLVEAVPGDYVLYGVSWEAGPPNLDVCMCLGTVGFSAKPGIITDMGYFLADRVDRESTIPEIRPESGFGPTMAFPRPLIGATVRPVRTETPVPDMLRGASVHPAEYRAVGKFVDRRAAAVNRLVPVPGILDYDDRGRVVDVKSGQVVADAH